MPGPEDAAGPSEGASPDDRQSENGSAEPGRPDVPAEILADLGTLRRRTRAARHAYWFPLVLFGALVAGSAPFFIRPAPAGPGSSAWAISISANPRPLVAFGGIFRAPGLSYYWLAAIVAGLALTGLWYRRYGTRIGLRTPSRAFMLTGLAITAVLLALSLAAGTGPLAGLAPGLLTMRGTLPLLIIAVALWVLARAERSPGLALTAALFTASALLADLYDVENLAFWLGWHPAAAQGRYAALPGVLLPAAVLLAAGAVAFAAQLRRGAGR